MTKRILIVSTVLLLSSSGMEWLRRPEHVPAREPLKALPLQFPGWEGQESDEFDSKTLNVLGVDDYVTRVYRANGVPVSLYVGYYESQRTGDTMHSPMRCLPGSGWQPLSTSVEPLAVDSAPGQRQLIHVNRYLVQKGLQRHVVLFWYQMHGRVIASEYATKLFLVQDAVRFNRTDGALVRVIVPVASGSDERGADETATSFVRALFPHLGAHLPV